MSAPSHLPPPVARLLTLGREPALRNVWPNYLHLGLEARHAGELIRLATAPLQMSPAERRREAWAPVHAWRALGQLGAAQAAEPLLAVLERDFGNRWALDELPMVLGMTGPAALPGATLLLFDETRPEPLRIAASRVIAEVGVEYPERAEEAAAIVTRQLEDWKVQSPLFNACLVISLVDLEETAAAPLMEAAYAAGAVEEALTGDWEDVQIELGLLSERITQPRYVAVQEGGSARQARAKQRRKSQKRSRQQNRRK